MRQLNSLLLIACIGLMLGCSGQPKYTGKGKGGTENYAQVEALFADPSGISENHGVSAIRLQALQETALSVSAQSALAWRSKQINAVVEQNDENLRRVFDFNSMLLPDNVLPPVLAEGRDTMRIDGDSAIRLADRTYKIISQARFVTTPPNWRQYLVMHYQPPPRPDNTLLPLTKRERETWKKYSAIGWKEGVQQANTIFAENLARLKRDYKGMALYRSLLAQNMVSMPYVAKSSLGITGNGEDMRINDQVLRITALPALQTNARRWTPAMSETDTGIKEWTPGMNGTDSGTRQSTTHYEK